MKTFSDLSQDTMKMLSAVCEAGEDGFNTGSYVQHVIAPVTDQFLLVILKRNGLIVDNEDKGNPSTVSPTDAGWRIYQEYREWVSSTYAKDGK